MGNETAPKKRNSTTTYVPSVGLGAGRPENADALEAANGPVTRPDPAKTPSPSPVKKPISQQDIRAALGGMKNPQGNAEGLPWRERFTRYFGQDPATMAGNTVRNVVPPQVIDSASRDIELLASAPAQIQQGARGMMRRGMEGAQQQVAQRQQLQQMSQAVQQGGDQMFEANLPAHLRVGVGAPMTYEKMVARAQHLGYPIEAAGAPPLSKAGQDIETDMRLYNQGVQR